jgi:TPR repeat protein
MRLAAQQGLAIAQYDLGLMYVRGRGVVRSRSEGIRWIKRAAAQGHAEALAKLDVLGERY